LDSRKLNSSYEPLYSIEKHFKLEAGPGSGKTTFIAEHVKRVLIESKRLQMSRKVACITYTNTGVNSLLERLGDARHEVEVSTIHSFLYKHVLQPYFWLLDDWPYKKGHIPKLFKQKLHGGHVKEIIRETNDGYLLFNNKIPLHEIVAAFESIKWVKRNEEYTFEFYPGYNRKLGSSGTEADKKIKGEEGWLRNASAKLYREKCHEEGILLYEDVIYFSYVLLQKHSKLQEIIRAKFPYLIVDEFQDTTSLQTDILKLLGQKEMVIGVIGDRNQSIYEFAGANVNAFESWELPGMKRYHIVQNRRTHKAIVDVLNYLKTDKYIDQEPIKCNLRDDRPIIILNTLQKAYQYCSKEWQGKIHVLGYNFDATVEKYNPEVKTNNFKEFSLFLSEDDKRGRKIRGTLKAILAMEKLDISIALEEIKAIQKRDGHLDEIQALKYLEKIRKTYKDYYDKSMKEYYIEILYEQKLIKTAKLTEGSNPSNQYSAMSLKNGLASIKNEDKKYQDVQTIHSMKGDEAENILVAIPDNNINFLTNPKLSNESHRVHFVAASRAKEKLAFQVNKEHKDKIKLSCDEKIFNIIDTKS